MARQPGADDDWPAGTTLARRGVGVMLAAVLAIGAATLAERLSGLDLHISLFADRDGSSFGRPSLVTAALLLLDGIALWLLQGGARSIAAAQALAFAGWMASLTALCGYLFGAHALYAVPEFGSVALHTSIALFVLQAGILCARPANAPVRVYFLDTPSSALARRLLVAVLLLVPLLAELRLRGQREGLYGTEFGIAILSVTLISLLIVLIGVGAHRAARAETLFQRLARLYMALSGTNQAIVMEADRETLLARVCEAAVHRAGFSIAWIGVTEGGIDGLVPAASAGAPAGFLENAMVFVRNDEATRERLRATLDYGRTTVINDLAAVDASARRDDLLRAGVRSLATLPIRADGRIAGLIYVYSRSHDYFGAAELALLTEMASDVGFGLARLSAQEQHRAAEAEVRRLNQEREDRVRRRTAALRQANEDLASFNYSASHDLRAPLRHIRSFIRLAQEEAGAALPPGSARMLERADAGAERLNALLEDMMSLARTRDAPFTPGEVDLSALAAEVCAELRLAQAEKPACCDIAPGLNARGDAALLRILFTNLLGNAWKYSSRCAEPKIAVGCEAGAVPVYFVRDNGAGFDMKYADKLFQPFRRLHGAQEFPGTGIGLAIVRRVVERHGGRIWVQAAPQAGATFYFTLHGDGQGADELPEAA